MNDAEDTEPRIEWKEIPPTSFDRILMFFGYTPKPRGYIPHRVNGAKFVCGTFLPGSPLEHEDEDHKA